MIDINLNGIWRCQKEALKVMLKQDVQREREGRGRIINMASMFGLFSPPKNIPFVAYTAAKHGTSASEDPPPPLVNSLRSVRDRY